MIGIVSYVVGGGTSTTPGTVGIVRKMHNTW